MPDQLVPGSIGWMTALFVSSATAIYMLWRNSGKWFKGSASSVFSLAKMLLSLKEGHERNEKKLADHEIRIRDLAWMKADYEAIHTKLEDHEGRLRLAERYMNEDVSDKAQMRKDMIELEQDRQLKSVQLNQIMVDLGVTAEQLRAMNQRGEVMMDQLQMMFEHIIQNPRQIQQPQAPKKKKKKIIDKEVT